jgi:predicted RNA binding protein YcfA (HicA-like mRNA interferase family)
MKLKMFTSFLLITSSFAMEKTDISAENYKYSYLADHFTTVPSLPATPDNFQANLNFIQDSERYFRLDKTSSIPLIQQYTEQAKQIYQARKLYLNDQKIFMELLHQKANAQNNTNLESLHPWLREFEDEQVIKILNFNINAYNASIDLIDNFLNCLDNPRYTFDDFFEKLMLSRTVSLIIREERKTKNTLPPPLTKLAELSNLCDYDRFLSLESITTFRILDENLYALFPHISQDCFNNVNTLNLKDLPLREGWFIKQDYALMQFLARQISVPFDPDTAWELRLREEKLINVYNYLTHKYEEIMAPIIPKEYTKLFNALYASLANESNKKDASFLPEEAKRFQQNRKQANRRSKIRQHAKNKVRAQASAKIIPVKNTSLTSEIEQVEVGSISILPQQSSPSKAHSSPTKPLRPTIPQGGWSLRDQQRNAEAQLKPQPARDDSTKEVVQVEFQPDHPITLSAGQYETLQEILNETAPAYKMTFNRVKDLLEAVGIKVERNGGSHARIHTPGHNVKTLVNIHYGWTDKYGPGTMKSLRTLIQNLSLDNPDFVRLN